MRASVQDEANIESSAAADEYYGHVNDDVYSTDSEYNEKSMLKLSIHPREEAEPNQNNMLKLQPALSTRVTANPNSLHRMRGRGKAVSMSMMQFTKNKKPQSLRLEGLGDDVYVDDNDDDDNDPMNNMPVGSWNNYATSRKYSYGNSIEHYSYIPDNASNASGGSSNSPSNPWNNAGGPGGIRFDNNSSGSGANGGPGGSGSGSSSFKSAIHDLLKFESYENEEVERKTTKILKNRYILGNLIGRGSFAKVKEAYDLKLHKIVAIKIFNVNKFNKYNIIDLFIAYIS